MSVHRIAKALAGIGTFALIMAAAETAAASSQTKIVDPEKRLTQAVKHHLADAPQISFGRNPFTRIYVLYKTTDVDALKLYKRMKRLSGIAEYNWVAFGNDGRARRGAAWMAYEPTEEAMRLLLRGEVEPPRIAQHKELQTAIANVQADVHNTLAPALKEITGKGLTSPLLLYRDSEGITYIFRGVPNRATIREISKKADW